MGCQLYLHVKDNRVVKVSGVEGAAPNYGSLCVKGRFGYDFIYSDERLRTPLIRRNGELQEATWDEALDYTADRLKEIFRNHPGTWDVYDTWGAAGYRLDVLVEGQGDGLSVGRSYRDAPEIDGLAYVTGDKLRSGQIVPCEMVAARGYDLIGAVVKDET